MKQKPSKIFMVRPAMFGFNPQTAGSNSFQKKNISESEIKIQELALKEFDAFIDVLLKNKIDVTVINDSLSDYTPDSIFPNNWISFHENNSFVLYPMLAENRRRERKQYIINKLGRGRTLIDFSNFENENLFLEGTGSIVFDYENKLAFANISPRTSVELFEKLCKQINYEGFSFKAVDSEHKDIYHTNVLLTIANKFVIFCKDCIPNDTEKKMLIDIFTSFKKEIIEISLEQMNSFAGNMYQLYNADGESFLIMSEQAYKSLNTHQISQLKEHTDLLYTPLYTIEKYGGGSARCMISDIRY